MKDYYKLILEHPRLFKNENALLEVITDPNEIKSWRKKQNLEPKEDESKKWADIGIVLDDPFFYVLRDLVKFPNGTMRGYSRVVNKADLKGSIGVVILPMIGNKLIIQHQYRHPTRSWHYEFPRGFGEPGISPEINAKKELREEINGEIKDIYPLGNIYPNSGLESTSVSVYMAILKSVGTPNELEGITSIIEISPAEFEEWIIQGKVTDNFSIVAYTLAKLKGLLD